jgi:hypothetical protein
MFRLGAALHTLVKQHVDVCKWFPLIPPFCVHVTLRVQHKYPWTTSI